MNELTPVQGRFVRKHEQASLLSISVRCLEQWMARKIVPYTRIGNVVLFDPIEVNTALARFKSSVR